MTDEPTARTLFVDDEETLPAYLSKRLLKMGHTVKAAFSGEQALAELLNETIVYLRPELKHSSLKIHSRFMPGTFHQGEYVCPLL